MSSIYKKGRDGYFYYQTYIYNPESGKKNKRIFHSLGTKNRVEAEEQKIQLDIKYNQIKRQNKHVPFYQKLSGYQILPKVIIIFLAVLLFTTSPKILASKIIKTHARKPNQAPNPIQLSISKCPEMGNSN